MSGLLLGTIDILFNPATTGSAAPLTTNTDCGTPGWTDKVCAGGPNQHRPCTVDTECTPGTCNEQCFCGGGAQKPNACEAACLGGLNDAQPCIDNPECSTGLAFCNASLCNGGLRDGLACSTNPDCTGFCDATGSCDPTGSCVLSVCVGGARAGLTCSLAADCANRCNDGGRDGLTCATDSDCANQCNGGVRNGKNCLGDSQCFNALGFCHPGDCRLNPSDTDSSQEGICTVGPSDGRCSVHTFKTCTDNAGCGGGLCPFCDPGETCVQVPRQCFVNPTMTRAGKPAVPFPVENDHDRTTAATFCIAITKSAAVNATAGLPGPGAITTLETISESPGF